MKTLKEFVADCGTIAEAARQLNVPHQTLDRWVKGKSKPSRVMVQMAKLKEIELVEPKPAG